MEYNWLNFNDHDPHFRCAADRAQTVSGVDLIYLDSLLELCVQKENNN